MREDNTVEGLATGYRTRHVTLPQCLQEAGDIPLHRSILTVDGMPARKRGYDIAQHGCNLGRRAVLGVEGARRRRRQGAVHTIQATSQASRPHIVLFQPHARLARDMPPARQVNHATPPFLHFLAADGGAANAATRPRVSRRLQQGPSNTCGVVIAPGVKGRAREERLAMVTDNAKDVEEDHDVAGGLARRDPAAGFLSAPSVPDGGRRRCAGLRLHRSSLASEQIRPALEKVVQLALVLGQHHGLDALPLAWQLQRRRERGVCLGPAQAGGAYKLSQRVQVVAAVGQDGRGDPEAELVARREGRDANEGQQRAVVAERVLDRRAGQAPPVRGADFAGGCEDFGAVVANLVGCRNRG